MYALKREKYLQASNRLGRQGRSIVTMPTPSYEHLKGNWEQNSLELVFVSVVVVRDQQPARDIGRIC
jgi:hypothetical protein